MYDWSSLKDDPHIANSFTLQLKNRFNVLQQDETECIINTYNNFILSCENAAKESIPLKKKIKKRVPWENEEVIKKRKRLHRMAEIKNSESTAIDFSNFNSARDNFHVTYDSEQ